MAKWIPSPNVLPGSTDVGSNQTDTHQFTGSVSVTGSLTLNGSAVSTGGGGGGGISWDGSTANGVATYKDADEATVESNLTFDGTTLTVIGEVTASGEITGSRGRFTGGSLTPQLVVGEGAAMYQNKAIIQVNAGSGEDAYIVAQVSDSNKNPVIQLDGVADEVMLYIDNDSTGEAFYIRRKSQLPPGFVMDNTSKVGIRVYEPQADFDVSGSTILGSGVGSYYHQVSGTLDVSGSTILSGSNTFGQLSTDAHQITGSLSINGAIVVTSSAQPQLTLGDTNTGGGMYSGKLQLNDGMSTTYPATIANASNVLVLSSSQDIHYQATSATGHKFLNYGTEALRVTNLHVSSSLNISGSSFYGDGANLTNVTSTPSPGGSDTQIQYNNGGAMGGAASFKFNDSTGQINISGASSPAKLVIGDDAGMNAAQIELASGMGHGGGGDEHSLIKTIDGTGLILSGANKIVHQTVNGSEFYKDGTKIVDIGVTADTLVATKLSSSFISNTYFSASIATPVNATCSVYNVFNYHLTANAEVTASSPVAGASYLFFFRQDGTGTRTVDFSGFKWPGGTAPTLSTAGGAVDIVSGISDGTYIYADTTKNFS